MRIFMTTILGALAAFIWGFIVWAVNPAGDALVNPNVAAEPEMMQQLATSLDKDGVYFFPSVPAKPTKEQQEQWTERHKQGPIGMVIFKKDGVEPMPPTKFLGAFAFYLISAAAMSLILQQAAAHASLVGRVATAALIGIFAGVSIHMMNWNWFYYPTEHSLIRLAEAVGGAVIMGVVIAPVVGKKNAATARAEADA